MADLLTKLDDYGYSDQYAFNSPGHKRTYDLTDFFEYYYKHDVGLVEDFDDLNNPEGILEECMKDAARIFGAQESFILVNGTTGGIHAAISATVPRGGRLLTVRNCSRAVYDSAFLRGIKLSYIYPKTDAELGYDKSITMDDIKMATYKDSYDAVFITCPSICGVNSDLEQIAQYLHEKQIPLIVDASYGSHFGLADFLPKGANACGADIVICDISETLPAPRQTGLLHINGSMIDREKISKYLAIFQSNAPSYVLMAGLDDCISYLGTGNAEDKWQSFKELREGLRDKLSDLKYLGIKDCYSDPSIEIGKIILYPKSTYINATMLYERLIEKHKIQPQLAMPNYVLLSLSLFDTEDGFDKLSEALHIIDEKLKRKEEGFEDTISLGSLAQLFNVTEKSGAVQVQTVTKYPDFPKCETALQLCDTEGKTTKVVNLLVAEGKVSNVFVDAYPIAQHILIPGEVISKEVLTLINFYKRHGLVLKGLNGDFIEIIEQ